MNIRQILAIIRGIHLCYMKNSPYLCIFSLFIYFMRNYNLMGLMIMPPSAPSSCLLAFLSCLYVLVVKT